MRVLICAVVIGLMPSASLLADIVVNFGGNYVSGSEPLNGNAFIGAADIDGSGGKNDEIGGRAFSATTQYSPLSNYSGTSKTFYGGAIVGTRAVTGGNTQFSRADVSGGTTDSVHLHAPGGSDMHDMHAVFLWDQADFLNGGRGIFFDSNSFATFDMGTSNDDTLVGAQVRLLVRDGAGNYWLSQTAFADMKNNASFTWNSGNQGFSATSDGNWASYDPTKAFPDLGPGTDLRFNQDDTGAFSAKNFTSIAAIGFLFEQDNFHNNLDFHFDAFQVGAQSVPEPTSLLSLSAVALFAIARFRRRAKKTATNEAAEIGGAEPNVGE